MTEQLQLGEQMSWIAAEMHKTDDVARRRRVVMQHLDPRFGERVLDIACGAGYVAKELGEPGGSNGKELGFDVSDPMLAFVPSPPLGAQQRRPFEQSGGNTNY